MEEEEEEEEEEEKEVEKVEPPSTHIFQVYTHASQYCITSSHVTSSFPFPLYFCVDSASCLPFCNQTNTDLL